VVSGRDCTGDQIGRMLASVGLDPAEVGGRRPYELSGGQCQRVAIARSLLLEPDLLVCDEPVSSLDVSVQAQILNLIREMKARYHLTVVFIAHDLGVVRNVSDRIAVMYLGKLCEIAPVDDLFGRPAHPYTVALLESIPEPDPDRPLPPLEIGGEVPSPIYPPSGCRFRTRCPRAAEKCVHEEPMMASVDGEHYVACHFPVERVG
jgi:peptide/nickel transport system ATP-binding protein